MQICPINGSKPNIPLTNPLLRGPKPALINGYLNTRSKPGTPLIDPNWLHISGFPYYQVRTGYPVTGSKPSVLFLAALLAAPNLVPYYQLPYYRVRPGCLSPLPPHITPQHLPQTPGGGGCGARSHRTLSAERLPPLFRGWGGAG